MRRILRRAVRYYYSFLDRQEPLMHLMVPMVASQFSEVFPEISKQEGFLVNIIKEEEKSFLRTLELGLKRIQQLEIKDDTVNGQIAFELYDTYGFPIDLTRLIASEKGWQVDEAGFEKALSAQRARGKADAKKSVGDWSIINPDLETSFIGYDQLTASDVKIVKHRTVALKNAKQNQVVLSETPFYAEGGGQIGDTGVLTVGDQSIKVVNTIKRE